MPTDTQTVSFRRLRLFSPACRYGREDPFHARVRLLLLPGFFSLARARRLSTHDEYAHTRELLLARIHDQAAYRLQRAEIIKIDGAQGHRRGRAPRAFLARQPADRPATILDYRNSAFLREEHDVTRIPATRMICRVNSANSLSAALA